MGLNSMRTRLTGAFVGVIAVFLVTLYVILSGAAVRNDEAATHELLQKVALEGRGLIFGVPNKEQIKRLIEATVLTKSDDQAVTRQRSGDGTIIPPKPVIEFIKNGVPAYLKLDRLKRAA